MSQTAKTGEKNSGQLPHADVENSRHLVLAEPALEACATHTLSLERGRFMKLRETKKLSIKSPAARLCDNDPHPSGSGNLMLMYC